MPELLFEIWADDPNELGKGSMFMVHPQNDKARVGNKPLAVLVHSYTAASSFETFNIYYEWTGRGAYQPPDDLDDHFFTEEEVRGQRQYLRDRKAR